MKTYYVYIVASLTQRLYIGITSNLAKRVWQHKEKIVPNSFTSKYNINRLVYYEETNDIKSAILKEKQLKKWNRSWKEKLINENNPGWNDLFNQINQ